MPTTILQSPSIAELLGFIDNVALSISDANIKYSQLMITAAFGEAEIELARSAYSATLLDN